MTCEISIFKNETGFDLGKNSFLWFYVDTAKARRAAWRLGHIWWPVLSTSTLGSMQAKCLCPRHTRHSLVTWQRSCLQPQSCLGPPDGASSAISMELCEAGPSSCPRTRVCARPEETNWVPRVPKSLPLAFFGSCLWLILSVLFVEAGRWSWTSWSVNKTEKKAREWTQAGSLVETHFDLGLGHWLCRTPACLWSYLVHPSSEYGSAHMWILCKGTYTSTQGVIKHYSEYKKHYTKKIAMNPLRVFKITLNIPIPLFLPLSAGILEFLFWMYLVSLS